MSRARNITIAALVVALASWCYGNRGMLFYVYLTWRQRNVDE